MTHSDINSCPKTDAYDKAMDGIDLCSKQHPIFENAQPILYTSLAHETKKNIKLTVAGLWRKKRDLHSAKVR